MSCSRSILVLAIRLRVSRCRMYDHLCNILLKVTNHAAKFHIVSFLSFS